jgi:hypothetical protein
MARYYLNSKDRKGLKKLVAQFAAGVGTPSARPVPTRRRFGAIGSTYQIVRGKAYTNVSATAEAFLIHDLLPLEQKSKTPTEPLWIANIARDTYTIGNTVYALYRKDISVTHPGAPATVDWEALKKLGTGGGGGLRYVQIRGDNYPDPAIEGATLVGSTLSPGHASWPEFVRDPDTGAFSIGAEVAFENVMPDSVTVAEGYYRLGQLTQDNAVSDIWVLSQVSCLQVQLTGF